MEAAATSRLAAALAERQVPWALLDGTAVLADLSGFTRLTESLMRRGAEGVEQLHRSLTTCFGALLDASLDAGGDVLGFAGDAALVWFDAEQHPDHVERAARAAASMPGDLAAIPAALTARSRVRASVGLHTGEFLAVPLRTGDRDGVVLCGPTMSMLARLEQAASAEQVLMSHDTAVRLSSAWAGATTADGVVLDRRRVRRAARPSTATTPVVAAGDDEATGRGEHRTASVGFVMVPHLDALYAGAGPGALADRVRHVADVVSSVAAATAITVVDTDVGADCVKFVLAAGAPRAVDEDDARLLRALRRIVDDGGVPIRVGAQRGPVFSGLLGARDRRTATVLGDTVNVAARALGRADDGDLVVADGLVSGLDRWMTADELGPQQLKNRVARMPMWRVRTVSPPPRRRPRASDAVVDLARREEWDRLTALWKETVDGGGASVAIIGEPGMGATELVADLLELTGGGTATSIVADRFLRDVPYSGVGALVTALANARDDTIDADLDTALAWLGSFQHRLAPSLHEWVPAAIRLVTGEVDPGTEPGTAARRARQVLVGLVTAAAPRPWLLSVEDADHFDHASQQVVAGLVVQATSAGHLVVTTHDEPDALSGAAEVTLVLAALSDDVVTEALHHLAPNLRDDQVARLVAAAGGNPLVLSNLLDRNDDADLPGTVPLLAAVVIDALPDAVRSAVLGAAAFGMEFDATVVAAVVGDPGLASPAIWRSAHRVLRTTDERVWRFRHDVFRDVASRTTSFSRRRRLHGAIADHLAADPDTDPALLGLHLAAAGRIHEAYPRTVAAATSAAARGAMVAAVDLYEDAIALARRVDPASLGRLHVELGRVRLRVGDLHGAMAAYGAAGRRSLDPVERLWLHHHRANLTLSRRQLRAADGWIRRGTAEWRELDQETLDPARSHAIAELGAHLMLDQAELLDLRGRHVEATVPARRALEIANRIGSARLTALAHLQLEAILFSLHDLEALDHGRSLIDLATELDDDRLLDQALNNTGLTAMYLGRWDEALEHYGQARSHAERCGHLADTAVIDQNTGFLLYRQGRLDEADALARRARRVLATVHADFEVGLCELLVGMVAIAQGRFDDAELQLAAARSRFEELGDAAMLVDCDVVGLDLLLRQGRTGEVIGRAVDVEPRLGEADAEVVVSFARIVGSAEVARAAEAADPATHDAGVARIREGLARARELHLLYEVYLCLGALVDATGDPDALAEHLELAATLGIVTGG